MFIFNNKYYNKLGRNLYKKQKIFRPKGFNLYNFATMTSHI